MVKFTNERLVLLYGSLITIIILNFTIGISGNDFWWHIKAGEWMISNLQIPYIDVFSWYGIQENLYWFSHEWFSEIVLYLIYYYSGELGIFSFSLLSAIFLVSLFVIHNKAAINNTFVNSFLFLLPTTLTMKLFFYGRPHLFSFFLLYGVLYCLYKFKENEQTKSIYFVPILAVLWANIHGGSSNLVYILCFMFLFTGLCNKTIGKLAWEKLSNYQLKIYAIVSLLSIIALCINPHGIKLLMYPIENMADTISMTYISEWAAPDAKNILNLLLFFFPFFLIVLAFSATTKKINGIDFVLFCFFALLFFRSQRFIMLFLISANFYAYKYFFATTLQKTHYKIWFSYLITSFFIGAIIFGGIKFKQNEFVISKMLTADFVSYIKAENPQRIYNDYNVGESLIFENIKVFVDGRADLYTKTNLSDALSLMNLKNIEDDILFDPESVIQKYNFDYILILNTRPLNAYLLSHPEKYTLLNSDATVSFFKIQ